NKFNNISIIVILTLNLFSTPLSRLVLAQTWSQIPTTGNPSQRGNISAVYDSRANRMIIFGGRTATANLNEIWGLNLNTNVWQNITPGSGQMPAPRFTQNAFFDSLMNRMIIWSGQGAELYNDVWAFNLNNNSWQQLWPDGNVSGAPLKRYGTAAVFDPINRRVVNFAGFTTSGRFDDTWYFQVDSMKWTDKTNSFHPEMRCLHSACISQDLQKMIVYGGQHNGAFDDIWSLNLNTFTWTNLTPAVKPSGRWFTSAICTKYGNVVIFGGQNNSLTYSDLWKFTLGSNQWDSVSQGIVRPSGRSSHSAIYIPVSDKMIIFGGFDNNFINDTWQFTNISTTGIENTYSVPQSFNLFQNYPNPFNPSTFIKYELAANGFVNLTVYDLLAKEIETLFYGRQNAGIYSIEFKAGELSSGIYFYKIEFRNEKSDIVFFDTKKMIVIK
ncbi:MAG: Kelch repeat-containing protein, partial [Ignavibacteria bacterium]